MATPLRVLLLEDRPEDAELALHELRRAGFAPEWTRVETEADYLARLDPALDLVLADYHLPAFDAPRALELLRARGVDVPFIVLSGTVDDQAALACICQGAADYLLKDRLARLGPAVTQALEAKRLRTAQERLQAQLVQNEKLAAMGQLLASVAHELNNPLSVVLGQAVLLAELAGDTTHGPRARKIAQAAERCARIVKNFLALARQQPPERRTVHLNAVVQEALELVGYLLRVDDVVVTLDLAQGLPTLWADPHQLHQVVVNLVTNAHQAMRGSSLPRRLTLATGLDPRASRVVLEVADTGPGIPPEIRSRIFEPFFTTKPPGQGTGLGLPLCHGIVEEHGGTMEVDEAPGGGAVFRVELPVAPPPAPPETITAAAPSPRMGRRVLVVDDEPEVASVLADLLAADGHLVDTAASGQAALARLEDGSYDVILSDLRMPGLDGPGLYREVRRRDPGRARRFVFLTGDGLSPETRAFLDQVDARLTLSKPFDLAEVRHVLSQALCR